VAGLQRFVVHGRRRRVVWRLIGFWFVVGRRWQMSAVRLAGASDRWPLRGGRRGGATVIGRAVWAARVAVMAGRRAWSVHVHSASQQPTRSPSMPSHGCCVAATGVDVLAEQAARDRVRNRFQTEPRGMCCVDDLLASADPMGSCQNRPVLGRRRLTAFGQCASLAPRELASMS